MIIRILFISLTLIAFNGCNKKPAKDHLRNVTLKLAPDVKATLSEVSNSGEELVLHPQIQSNGVLTDVQIKVVQEVENQSGVVISEESFVRHEFKSDSLKDIIIKIPDIAVNNKIVFIVSGKVDGNAFNISAIHNSLFQKEIEDAKIRLQERSRRK